MSFRGILTNLCRTLVGVLFIFSGLIKANDPIGFSYKMNDYFGALDMTALDKYSLIFAFTICFVEVVLGILLLLGVYKKIKLPLLLITIAFFAFLTGFTLINNWIHDNPDAAFSHWAEGVFHFKAVNLFYLTDCGCFGDAIKLKPVTSFLKDIVLLVLILFIIANGKDIKPLFRPGTSQTIAFMGAFLTLLFTFYCYYFLPVKDFLPFGVGKDIKLSTETPPNAPKDSMLMEFTYLNKTENKPHIFDINHIPTDTNMWKCVGSKCEIIKEGYHPPIHDFILSDSLNNDVTQTFFDQPGYRLMIVQYDLATTNTHAQGRLNSLVNGLKKAKNFHVWALTSSTGDDVKAYRKKYNVPYVYYAADVTLLKTMIRANPGLILIKDNVIINRWPASLIPDASKLKSLMK